MKDFMFKPSEEHSSLKLEYEKKGKNGEPDETMDLDNILEKIEQQGLESLTPDEKKFLDGFQNWNILHIFTHEPQTEHSWPKHY